MKVGQTFKYFETQCCIQYAGDRYHSYSNQGKSFMRVLGLSSPCNTEIPPPGVVMLN